MGQVLQWGLLQGWEPVGVAGLWGRRLVSTISWHRFGGLQKVTEEGLIRMDPRRGCGSLLKGSI